MSNGLEEVLTNLGVSIKRQTGDEINGQCPVHHLYKGRPSNGYHWYINVDSGLWQCFTCGARGNLPFLVSQVTNDPHAIHDVQMFMTQAGLDARNSADEEEEQVVADWKDYAAFSEVPEVLLEARNLDPDTARRYGIRFNKNHKSLDNGDDRSDYKCWITPVLDPTGNLMGWQAKQGRYFINIPTGLHKSESLFGYNFARGGTALLVESPLDVVRFHSVYKGDDIQCVSSYGASVSSTQLQMLRDKFNSLILALDNDEAGHQEALRLKGRTRHSKVNLLNHRGKVWHWVYPEGVKDIGDMTDDQIMEGLDNLSRSLLVA